MGMFNTLLWFVRQVMTVSVTQVTTVSVILHFVIPWQRHTDRTIVNECERASCVFLTISLTWLVSEILHLGDCPWNFMVKQFSLSQSNSTQLENHQIGWKFQALYTCLIDLKNCVTKSRYRSNDSFGNFAFRYRGSDMLTEQSYTSAREIAAYFWQFRVSEILHLGDCSWNFMVKSFSLSQRNSTQLENHQIA